MVCLFCWDVTTLWFSEVQLVQEALFICLHFTDQCNTLPLHSPSVLAYTSPRHVDLTVQSKTMKQDLFILGSRLLIIENYGL